MIIIAKSSFLAELLRESVDSCNIALTNSLFTCFNGVHNMLDRDVWNGNFASVLLH